MSFAMFLGGLTILKFLSCVYGCGAEQQTSDCCCLFRRKHVMRVVFLRSSMQRAANNLMCLRICVYFVCYKDKWAEHENISTYGWVGCSKAFQADVGMQIQFQFGHAMICLVVLCSICRACMYRRQSGGDLAVASQPFFVVS